MGDAAGGWRSLGSLDFDSAPPFDPNLYEGPGGGGPTSGGPHPPQGGSSGGSSRPSVNNATALALVDGAAIAAGVASTVEATAGAGAVATVGTGTGAGAGAATGLGGAIAAGATVVGSAAAVIFGGYLNYRATVDYGMDADYGICGGQAECMGAISLGKAQADAAAREQAKRRRAVVIGLGLADDLWRNTAAGAITYQHGAWQELGLTDVPWRLALTNTPAFLQSFEQAAGNAAHIRFDVTTFIPGFDPDGITQQEFNRVLDHWRSKTTFYRNGRPVEWDGKNFIPVNYEQ